MAPARAPLTPVLAWIDDDTPLPATRAAMGADDDAPGLLAAGGRVTVARLEEAYRKGVFPWFGAGQPVLWWSPDPRMVLPVAEFRLSRTMRKTLRRFARTPECVIQVDSAFADVISACAHQPRPGQDGTWILPNIAQAYLEWHRQGRVHSVETWVDGALVGGLYGVAIGRMFFGESMFSRQPDASKIALAALVALCRRHGITLIDCQQNTGHLASMGAREITREAFEQHLARVLRAPDIDDWTYDGRLWRELDFESAPQQQDPTA